jgi:hypothetical protein
MPIFFQRFILPILCFLVTGLCLLNPWKWDWQQRVSLILGVTFIAYFFAYTSSRIKPDSAQSIAPIIRKTGDATTSGSNSPANTGDENTFQNDQSPPSVKKPDPPKEHKP